MITPRSCPLPNVSLADTDCFGTARLGAYEEWTALASDSEGSPSLMPKLRRSRTDAAFVSSAMMMSPSLTMAPAPAAPPPQGLVDYLNAKLGINRGNAFTPVEGAPAASSRRLVNFG